MQTSRLQLKIKSLKNTNSILHSCRRQAGFTLIELIVVIGIIAITSSVSFAAFNSYAQKQRLQNSVNQFASAMQEAKAGAQAQIKPQGVNVCQNNPLVGYKVILCGTERDCKENNENTYELHVVCGDKSRAVKTFSLPADMRIRSGRTSFEFKIITGLVEGASANGSDITIQRSDDVKQTITVYQDGRIVIR